MSPRTLAVINHALLAVALAVLVTYAITQQSAREARLAESGAVLPLEDVRTRQQALPAASGPHLYQGPVPLELFVSVPPGSAALERATVALELTVPRYQHQDYLLVGDDSASGPARAPGHCREEIALGAAQLEAVSCARGRALAIRLEMPGLDGAPVTVHHASLKLWAARCARPAVCALSTRRYGERQ